MPNLFSPITIRNIEFKNRIAVSPMCQYSSADGFANDWHLVHLGSRAVGGAGLIIFEASAVSPDGRISPADLGIWKDDHVEGLERIVKFIEAQGSRAGIQLAHAGRKASTSPPWEGGGVLVPGRDTEGWQTVAPSPVPFRNGGTPPKALDLEGIQEIIFSFKAAAERSLKAGFKVIEIHAAHGYLIHEFLSPLSNFRNDRYGGTFENRIRLLIEITDVVRSVWPEGNPLFVRISATDWTEGGWTVDDSIALANILKYHGVDLIDCSSGGNIPNANIPVAPAYQVAFAENIKKATGVLTGAVGLITTVKDAESIISNGRADIVLLARELLRDPYFALHAAKKLDVPFKWPLQYERAKN
jgi:2,4-dienoyl-CoA reductase-like NADH-dependent reductase (Old Yellow Enzyme family)